MKRLIGAILGLAIVVGPCDSQVGAVRRCYRCQIVTTDGSHRSSRSYKAACIADLRAAGLSQIEVSAMYRGCPRRMVCVFGNRTTWVDVKAIREGGDTVEAMSFVGETWRG